VDYHSIYEEFVIKVVELLIILKIDCNQHFFFLESIERD
jgi:hypothetical protein